MRSSSRGSSLKSEDQVFALRSKLLDTFHEFGGIVVDREAERPHSTTWHFNIIRSTQVLGGF